MDYLTKWKNGENEMRKEKNGKVRVKCKDGRVRWYKKEWIENRKEVLGIKESKPKDTNSLFNEVQKRLEVEITNKVIDQTIAALVKMKGKDI
jgi:hypothetical protein